MNKIRAFLISFALIFSASASAVTQTINTLSVDTATVSLNSFLGPLSLTHSFNPTVDIVMGTFQKNIIEFGSPSDPYFLEIYSSGTYGAFAPTGTVDAETNTIDVDFSSLRATLTKNDGVSTNIFDISFFSLFDNPITNTYNGNTGMFDMSWETNANVDILGLSLDSPFVLNLKGSVSAVPVPAAVWLFGSGMVALFGFSRKKYS